MAYRTSKTQKLSISITFYQIALTKINEFVFLLSKRLHLTMLKYGITKNFRFFLTSNLTIDFSA